MTPSHQVTQTMVDSQIWIGDSFYTQFGIADQPPRNRMDQGDVSHRQISRTAGHARRGHADRLPRQ